MRIHFLKWRFRCRRRRCCLSSLMQKCLISRFVEDGNTRQQLSFSFSELWYSSLEFNSKKIANIWRIKRDGRNKREKVLGSANSVFKWRFCSRRRRCCLRWPISNDWNPISQQAVFSEVSLFCVCVFLFCFVFGFVLFCFFHQYLSRGIQLSILS